MRAFVKKTQKTPQRELELARPIEGRAAAIHTPLVTDDARGSRAREGGEVQALTTTARDEFSPSVSRDGRRIAHVSNHLGNIDVFTMPAAGGEKEHVAITGLKFRRAAGKVRVQIKDALGKPARARLYVRAGDGKAYAPAGAPLYYYPLEPGGGREGFFVAGGDDTFPVPAGPLTLVALKGVEHRAAETRVEVAPDTTSEATLILERWTDWSLCWPRSACCPG